LEKTNMKMAIVIVATLVSSAALAAELPSAVQPVQKIDPADQLVRTTAVANALYRDKQRLESEVVGLESDNASLEAKLSNEVAHSQGLQKEIDDAKKAKTESNIAPASTGTQGQK
jgi:hypothetical protein